jgi:hypothetical protein
VNTKDDHTQEEPNVECWLAHSVLRSDRWEGHSEAFEEIPRQKWGKGGGLGREAEKAPLSKRSPESVGSKGNSSRCQTGRHLTVLCDLPISASVLPEVAPAMAQRALLTLCLRFS